ncbi:MAG: putative metallopeptidase [Candidatus Nanoarchaeia archaeon]
MKKVGRKRMRYEKAEDIEQIAREVVEMLGWHYISLDNVGFVRSYGSKARGTIARCHALGKAMQVGMDRKGFYLIEVISKRFDKLSHEDKIKTIIHELMHIPKTFGGGFRHHNFVNEKNVKKVYEHYIKLKSEQLDRWV